MPVAIYSADARVHPRPEPASLPMVRISKTLIPQVSHPSPPPDPDVSDFKGLLIPVSYRF